MKKVFLSAIIVAGISLCSISCTADDTNFSKNTQEEFLTQKTTDSIAGDTGGQDGNLPTNP